MQAFLGECRIMEAADILFAAARIYLKGKSVTGRVGPGRAGPGRTELRSADPG